MDDRTGAVSALSGAQWIWPRAEDRPNTYADFYVPFTVPAGEGTLFISADTDFYAMLNGEELPDCQYSDWPRRKAVESVQLRLREGKNDLRLRVWYVGRGTSTYRKGTAGVRFSVFRGEKQVCVSGPGTLCRMCGAYRADVPLVTGQLGFSFDYAEREDGFWGGSPDLSAFGAAAVREIGAALFPRPVRPPLRGGRIPMKLRTQGVYACRPEDRKPADRMQFAALSFREGRELFASAPAALPDGDGLKVRADLGGAQGVYLLLDAGKETAGDFEIEMEADGPCEVLVGYGEHLADLRVRTSVGSRSFAAVYRARKGRGRFLHPFLSLGCRYLMLFVASGSFTLYYAGLRPVDYPLRRAPGLPAPRDLLVRRILDVCGDTLRLCIRSHYEDCPWREQAYYGMDSRTQMLCGYYLFREYDMPRASLQLAADGLRPDGLLEMCSPSDTPIDIPSFTLMWPVQLWEYALYSGDTDFARRQLPVLRKILGTFEKRRKGGVQTNFTRPGYWNFYEWTRGLDGGAIGREEDIPEVLDAPLTAFHLLAAQASAKLFRALGLGEEAERQEALLADGRAAFSRTFFDAGRGLYANFRSGDTLSGCSALTQSLAVLAGAAGGDVRGPLLEKLFRGEGMVPASLSGSIFRYEALLREKERYAEPVAREIASVWGNMLFAGATSFWETELGEADFERAGSLCHGWSAVPAYICYAYGLFVPRQDIARLCGSD